MREVSTATDATGAAADDVTVASSELAEQAEKLRTSVVEFLEEIKQVM